MPIKEAKAALARTDKNCAELSVKIDARIADIENGRALCLPALPGRYKVGEVGRFAATVSVVQIIDGQTMIVRGTISSELSSALAEFNGDGETDIRRTRSLVAWLKGRPTAGLPTGAVVDLKEAVLEVTGTKTYETTAGTTRTVLVLEPFDLEPVKAAMKVRGN